MLVLRLQHELREQVEWGRIGWRIQVPEGQHCAFLSWAYLREDAASEHWICTSLTSGKKVGEKLTKEWHISNLIVNLPSSGLTSNIVL